jgi:predicted  nucleic acid-binding Zn-ribbon protein
MTTENPTDRLAALAPHQQEFHKVLVDDFEKLSIRYRNAFIGELEQRDRARYAQLDEIRRQTDDRHDALIREIDALIAVVRDVTAQYTAANAERQALYAELVDLRDEVRGYMAHLSPGLAVLVGVHEIRITRIETHLGLGPSEAGSA